jgi:hypothetical protein
VASGGRAVLLALAAAVALLVLLALTPGAQHRASACAFLRTPTAYEAEQSRLTYLATIDAASVNALFPGDLVFSLPAVEVGTRGQRTIGVQRVPATLLKAIAWEESTLTMASRATKIESIGAALISFDCGHGVMQVTTGMTVPLGGGGLPSSDQVKIATHFGYNIARGASILAEKWNAAPQTRPVVGTDTASNPDLIENWYMATWAYNGFAGPGSFSSNHPSDPTFGAWPREQYRCDGTQSRRRYPYQELVWGCMAAPPTRDDALLWQPIAASLPNLSEPRFFDPLSLANWVFPYSAMDLPSPSPVHLDPAPTLAPGIRERILGVPRLEADAQIVRIRLNGLPQDQWATVRLPNLGVGIVSWVAKPEEAWIVTDPPGGVSLGLGVSCPVPDCERTGEITLTVNPTLLQSTTSVGILRIVPVNGNSPTVIIRIEIDADFEVAAPGTSRAD